MRIVCIVGTRPEAIKMAPVVHALRRTEWAEVHVLLTGQHRSLLDQALAQFDLAGDIDLGLMQPNQKLGGLTGRAFLALEGQLTALAPDLVLAQGDTTTVMAAAVSCFYLNIAFGHVEAGLRTGQLRNPFPEEFNRLVASLVADLHFAPTQAAADALLAERTPPDRVLVTGNTVIDALQLVKDKAPPPDIDRRPGEKLILMTAHRRENFGPPLEGVFQELRALLQSRSDVRLLYPVHPNPNVRDMAMRVFDGCERAHLVEPLGYLDFVGAMKAAEIIVTDSGGVQEEAPAFGKPVLVMRHETERPEAISFGVAKLIGANGPAVRAWVERLLDDPAEHSLMARGVSPYGDGLASERIVHALALRAGRSDFPAPPPFQP